MTSFALKMIAILAMTLDHAAKILGQEGLLRLFPEIPLTIVNGSLGLMQNIGRMVFPIYAFLIGEGAGKTRSMPRYMGRLALFAILSEPIFYYGFHSPGVSPTDFVGALARFRLTNVFFTLLLGAMAIYMYQLCIQKGSRNGIYVWIPVLFAILLIGNFIGCDYEIVGILLIVALYLAREKAQKVCVILIWSAIIYVLNPGLGNWEQIRLNSVLNGVFSAVSAVGIWLYNGKQGKSAKWLFYGYYPVHLFVLVCLRDHVR
mgnify:CR=1 FL=1